MPEEHPTESVSKERTPTNHTFHLLMSLFTCGLWAFTVWPAMVLWHWLGPRRATKTEYR